jgi:type IV pilus assembly protein PilW
MPMPLSARTKLNQQKQTGFSLIELMVSMAIGLVVLGALIFTYLSGIKGNANAQAQAQVSEDAQVALNVIAQNIRQAGFATGNVAGIDLDLNRGGFAFFACDTGFSNDTTAAITGHAVSATAAANMSALTCAASSAANVNGVAASFAVAYEADTSNTKQNGAGFVTDCNGFGLGVATGIVVENRFFLNNGTLYCAGSQAATGVAPVYDQAQPLVNGVESMHFQFGLAGLENNLAPLAFNDSQQVEGYAMTTSEIGPATGTNLAGVNSSLHAGLNLTLKGLHADSTVVPQTTPTTKQIINLNANAVRWRLVRTVRICIVGKNDEVLTKDLAVAGANPQYYDCNGTLTNITDGKMRKAYATTVFLRNLNRSSK